MLRLKTSEIGEQLGLPYLYDLLKAHVWQVEKAEHLGEEVVEGRLKWVELMLSKLEERPQASFRLKSYFLNLALWSEETPAKENAKA